MNRSHRSLILSLTFALSVVSNSFVHAEERFVDHAVIVSIDGGRPDLLLRADMPNLRSIMKRGAFSFWARTTPVAITLPSHTTMVTGVKVERHGVTWNGDEYNGKKYPKSPTLFEVAHKAGLSTAMVTGKTKFAVLAKPGTVDYMLVPKEYQSDQAVADSFAKMFKESEPGVTLVHFGDNDTVGHAVGWGTAEEIAALERADHALGTVLTAIDDAGVENRTLLLITADHGGQGRGHGAGDPRSRHIPWIIAGPRTLKDYDLTRFDKLTIDTQDTFATVCYALGLTPPNADDGQPIDGKIIREAFDQPELLAPAVEQATINSGKSPAAPGRDPNTNQPLYAIPPLTTAPVTQPARPTTNPA